MTFSGTTIYNYSVFPKPNKSALDNILFRTYLNDIPTLICQITLISKMIALICVLIILIKKLCWVRIVLCFCVGNDDVVFVRVLFL
ncbi:MAG: hypothetical protein LBC74_02515 [Planctomycetaceae bacterium]|nr:hypothetical protein [Planctomycetaceae bacterium]